MKEGDKVFLKANPSVKGELIKIYPYTDFRECRVLIDNTSITLQCEENDLEKCDD